MAEEDQIVRGQDDATTQDDAPDTSQGDTTPQDDAPDIPPGDTLDMARGDTPDATRDDAPTTPTQAEQPSLDDDVTPVRPDITATLRMPRTEEAPRDDASGPTAQASEPASLGDVGATIASWASGRAEALRATWRSYHLIVTIAALACVAVALGLTLWAADRGTRAPSDEQVVADALARLSAPSYTLGDYAIDQPLTLRSVEVAGSRASGTRGDGCEVDVVAYFSNAGMETRADGRLSYVRNDGEWACTAATVGNASHRATAGVSQERVVEHLEALLQEADEDDGRSPLPSIYRDATVEVLDETFDEGAQTDEVTLHCSTGGAFVSYECDLVARFRFAPASGAWELAEASASDGAKDVGLSPLVGTWRGTFASQDADAGKCLAARDAGLQVSVTRATLDGGDGAAIEGTISGIAHLHPEPGDDVDASDGDQMLQEVPFAGTLASGDVEMDVISLLAGNRPKKDYAGIVFECATQDLAGGTVTLTLAFGSAMAPDKATATLASRHSYQGTFLFVVPYQREARFTDHFELEKAD